MCRQVVDMHQSTDMQKHYIYMVYPLIVRLMAHHSRKENCGVNCFIIVKLTGWL